MKKLALMLAGLLLAAPLYAAEDNAGTTTTTDTKATAPASSSASGGEGTASASSPAAAKGEVARSAFTSGVDNREPTDNLTALENNQTKIYYFTELRNMQGQTVKHRWEYNGKVMAEVPFQITGARWRTYSSKKLDPSWQGEWKASVIDEAGNTLSVNTFTYKKADADTGSAAASDSGAANDSGATGSTAPAN